MLRPKRRRIFYVPGMISLLFVPFLFVSFAEKEIKSRDITCLKVNIGNRDLHYKYPEFFPDSFPPLRNYTEIAFTGNNKNNQIKLNFAQVRIKEILEQNDSISGVHFTFGDSSEFWTFVKALDILNQENAVTYATEYGNIWFCHYPPDTTIKYWICGTKDVGFSITPILPWWEEAFNWMKLSWKNSWNLITGFIGFILMAIILKRRKRITI